MSQNENTDTMADVSHKNPLTGETAGRLFSRGPTVVTDGGERTDAEEPSATDPTERTEEEPETMADVEHTPPQDADDANRVFERGRKPTVEEEE